MISSINLTYNIHENDEFVNCLKGFCNNFVGRGRRKNENESETDVHAAIVKGNYADESGTSTRKYTGFSAEYEALGGVYRILRGVIRKKRDGRQWNCEKT